MPNLRSIILPSSDITDGKITSSLDSVVIVHRTGNLTKRFPDIFPNLKELILSEQNRFTPIIHPRIERLKLINIQPVYERIGTTDFYFPNVKYIEIRHDCPRSYDILKILKSFPNLKILMLYLCWYGYDSEGPDLDRLFGEQNLIEILKNYQIKHAYDACQFIKKFE